MSRERTDTRKRILDAARDLLEKQSRSVRMSDIARSAGISRQALYLHFPTRAELLIAVTRHLDKVKDIDARLAASRNATGGAERLRAFIEAWGNYIPEIYGVARALMAMKDTDAEAGAAWEDRMQAVREGCEAAIVALENDGALAAGWNAQDSTDFLWALLSVRNWEHLRMECGWDQAKYISRIRLVAESTLIA